MAITMVIRMNEATSIQRVFYFLSHSENFASQNVIEIKVMRFTLWANVWQSTHHQLKVIDLPVKFWLCLLFSSEWLNGSIHINSIHSQQVSIEYKYHTVTTTFNLILCVA